MVATCESHSANQLQEFGKGSHLLGELVDFFQWVFVSPVVVNFTACVIACEFPQFRLATFVFSDHAEVCHLPDLLANRLSQSRRHRFGSAVVVAQTHDADVCLCRHCRVFSSDCLDGSLAQQILSKDVTRHGLVPRSITAEEVPDEVFPDLSFWSCAEGVLGTLLRPCGHHLGLPARSRRDQ